MIRVTWNLGHVSRRTERLRSCRCLFTAAVFQEVLKASLTVQPVCGGAPGDLGADVTSRRRHTHECVKFLVPRGSFVVAEYLPEALVQRVHRVPAGHTLIQ